MLKWFLVWEVFDNRKNKLCPQAEYESSINNIFLIIVIYSWNMGIAVKARNLLQAVCLWEVELTMNIAVHGMNAPVVYGVFDVIMGLVRPSQPHIDMLLELYVARQDSRFLPLKNIN